MYRSILQTKQWAQLKEKYGQTPHWISDVLALEHKLPLGKSFLYMPEVDQVQLHDMDKAKLDELAKETSAVFARAEIANPVQEKADYFDEALKGFVKSRDEIQPTYRQVIDIRGTMEQILAQMKSKGRYNIKVAQRHNVDVKNYGCDSIHRAANIGHEMSFWGKSENVKSDKNAPTPLSSSANEAVSPRAGENNNLPLDKPVPSVPEGGELEGVDPVKIFYSLYRETIKRERITGRSIDYFYDLVDILGAAGLARVLVANYQDKPLAAAIVTFYEGVASYLYGGSSRENREVMAPFAMHNAIIEEAKKRGCRSYDLLGIAPLDRPNHKWAGLTRFKENFGGKRIEIIGCYDKVYQNGWYRVFRLLRKR